MIDVVLDKVVEQCRKPEVQQKMEDEIVAPLVRHIGSRVWPYIVAIAVYLTVISVALVLVVYLLWRAI